MVHQFVDPCRGIDLRNQRHTNLQERREEMIWAWIKSLFNPEPQKDPHLQLYEDPDYSTMSKGDLKKLLAQGKIKSIYKPWV